MSKLGFEYYMGLKEMAVARFGKHAGKHINDIDKGYATWLLNNVNPKDRYPPKFDADDGSGLLSMSQVLDALKVRAKGQMVAPTSVGKPIQSISQTSSIEKSDVVNPSSQDSPSAYPSKPTKQEPDPAGAAKARETEEDRLKKQIPAEKISEYQKNIDKAFVESNKHLMINALAGTGKTTILKHLAAKYGKGQNWLYLVFNKMNQIEAESSFPEGVVPKTSHSFMMGVIRDTISENPGAIPGYSSFKLEPKKIDKITDKDTQGEWFFDTVKRLERSLPNNKHGWMIRYNQREGQETVSYGVKTRVKTLVGLAKNYAVDPRSPDAFEKIKAIFKKHQDEKRLTPYVFSTSGGNDAGPDFTDEWVKLTIEVLRVVLPGGTTGDKEVDLMKDFDDMLWHPSLSPEKLAWPGRAQYPVALVDEVQDFNEAQKIMLENLAKRGIRIIAVGDPNQAIYGFRGADAKGFSNVESLLASSSSGVSTHDLPVNYRSGKKIIDFVNNVTHVKTLAAGRDHDGEVNEDVPQEGLLSQVTEEWEKGKSLSQETAFISRNNAPLFGIAVGLLQKGIPFKILGSDFSEEILEYIYTATGEGKAAIGRSKAKSTDVDRFLDLSERYLSREIRRYEDKKEKEKYLSELKKFHEALIGFITGASAVSINQIGSTQGPQSRMRTVQDLCDAIKSIFKGMDPAENEKDREAYKKIDKKKTVILTTAHKSKGLEFERVNIVANELFPIDSTPSEGDEQEHNAKYVAYTRATHTLNISDSPKES